jgi:hypothetical protein
VPDPVSPAIPAPAAEAIQPPPQPTGPVPIWVAAAALISLLSLLFLAFAYVDSPTFRSIFPATFGPIPIVVPWFGALGGVVASMYGIIGHSQDWDTSLNIWHVTRPLMGAVMGVVACLAYLFLVSAAGSKPSADANVALGLAAFVVGNSDKLFHQLIQKVSNTLFSSEAATSQDNQT